MSDQPYPEVSQQAHFPKLEEAILRRWADEKTFQASIDRRDGAEDFVFYDGPPFANGLPHYGHLLTSYVKDTVPRYQTMRGKRVDRRFGWDTHGLPVEMLTEKELGLSGKAAIVDYGMEKFNDACRTSVLRYTNEWETTITRAARWVDFENDYRTLDINYMESVMWAFKTLHDKGLMYEGQRVLAYCWECETPLSNFETRMDDAYRERTDPAVTVAFPLSNGQHLLVWTTTPWTLPSNQAVAVGPDVDYAVFQDEDDREFVLGAGTLKKYKQQLAQAEQIGTIKGSDLIGLTYEPLFDFFAPGTANHQPNSFQVISADFVDDSEGTGAVHMSPAFGEDDYNACTAAGIEMVMPVDQQAKFTSLVPPYAGLQVFEANPQIVEDLKAKGVLVKREQYAHSYPHCWRTDTPLIYKAMSSWFVKVTAIKDQMLANNQKIDWIPENVKDGAFGKWLEGARDWSISRNRFWGAPIPVWVSSDPAYPRVDVYGSLEQMEADFGRRPDNLHRPYIDEFTRPNPDDPTGKSIMRRVDDVLDCWFESGSMPFAQVHYPFENTEWFENNYPADFIVEYIGQTRGWFYTLHILATALFDRPAFKTVVAHGMVLGDDGRKLSKRLKNYPDVTDAFDTFGSDAVRWSLFAAPVLRGGETMAERDNIIQASRQVLVPIWNAWYFLSLYGNSDGLRGTFRTDQTGALDRYILAKTAELRDNVTATMDAYDPFGATQHITRYIDALNNWYIRRSRERFWRAVPTDGSVDPDKQDAYDTLHTVLASVTRIVAPLLPMLSEEIYTKLTGEQSVHLTDWLGEDELPHDHDLVRAMDAVRDVCGEVLSIRKEQRLRVRLPLAKITVATPDAEALRPFVGIIKDEVNVKDVVLTTDTASVGEFTLQVIPGVVGPRVGGKVQQILAAARTNDWTNDNGTVICAGEPLQEGEFDLRFKPVDPDTSRSLPGNVGVVVLDTEVTPELALEGLARDIVRAVQGARRDAGLSISDHIELNLKSTGDVAQAIEAHGDYIAGQTLTSKLTTGLDESDSAEMFDAHVSIEGTALDLRLRRNA